MNRVLRIIFIIASIIVLLLSVYYLKNIFVYLLVAVVLSLFGRPIMSFLSSLKIGKFNFPNWLAALLTVITFYCFIALFIAAFMPLIVHQISLILAIDPVQVINGLEEPLNRLSAYLEKFYIDPPEEGLAESLRIYLTKWLNPEKLTGLFGSVFGIVNNLFSYIVAVFAITFITFFFLADKDLLYTSLSSLVPVEFEAKFDKVVNKAKELLTRYIYGILVQVTTITIYVTLGMMILGVGNALLVGLFSGFVNIIPYVGPIIGLAFGIFVVITTNLGMDFYGEMLPLILKVCVVFGSMQILDNMFLQPLIFSNSVKAHPLEIFLLILIAGTLAGIPGMILAIPAYTIFRVVAKEFLSEFKIIQKLTRNI